MSGALISVFTNQRQFATVPGAPTSVTATAGSGNASVSFSPPASDGGSAITSYTVTSSPGSFTGTGSSSPITVSGLTNGTAYTFTVTATNAIGTGPASSASNSITPVSGYWEALLYGTGGFDWQGKNIVSSSGIMYVGGVYGGNIGMLQSYNTAATTFTSAWTNTPVFYDSTCCGNTGYVSQITIDSSSNVYIAGVTNGNRAALLKYNSSGTLLAKKHFSSCTQTRGGGIAVDTSGNIFFAGEGGSNGFFVNKYNSSFSVQWRRSLTAINGGYYYFNSVALNSGTGAIYFTATVNSTAGCAIIALTSTGTTSWSRKLSNGADNIQATDLKLDSAGNVYVSFFDIDLSIGLVAKYNSSGTIQWQRRIAGCLAWAIALDSSDNVYMAAETRVAKWNSSGTLQWQRVFSGTNIPNLRSIAVSGSSMYISGELNSRAVTFVLPTDGSRTGTFPTLATYSTTYAVGSATEAVGGMTEAALTTTNSADTSLNLQDAPWTTGTRSPTKITGAIP